MRSALGAFVALCASAGIAWGQTSSVYRDPQGRFRFEYPSSMGAPGVGTDSGFRDRVAAVRFDGLVGLGGEVALLKGRVMLDVQAAGGLYDSITLSVFPDREQLAILAALVPITERTMCDILAREDHLGPAPLSAQTLQIARQLDRMRNANPRVVTCEVRGRVVVFDKEITYESPAVTTRQRIFGAVRFLDAPYAAVQLIRALPAAPSENDLETAARIVASFELLR